MFVLLFLLLGGGWGEEKREETTHNKNKSKQTHLLFPHTFPSSRGLECLLPDKATFFEYKTKNHPCAKGSLPSLDAPFPSAQSYMKKNNKW